jgi:hypothetical protein
MDKAGVFSLECSFAKTTRGIEHLYAFAQQQSTQNDPHSGV